MAVCPKCGKKILKSATKCPYCHKLIAHQHFNGDIKLKPIPLKVKPVKEVKDLKKGSFKTKSNLSYSNTLTIFLIVALVLINALLLLNLINQFSVEKPSTNTDDSKVIIPDSRLGNWLAEDNNLFIFADDNNFFWYDSSLNLKDNYYTGTYNYKNGLAALEEMGYTEEEFYQTFGNDLKLENVYSLNLFPTSLHKNSLDLSSSLATKETWWFLLIIKNEKTALGYNKTLDLRYTFTRY